MITRSAFVFLFAISSGFFVLTSDGADAASTTVEVDASCWMPLAANSSSSSSSSELESLIASWSCSAVGPANNSNNSSTLSPSPLWVDATVRTSVWIPTAAPVNTSNNGTNGTTTAAAFIQWRFVNITDDLVSSSRVYPPTYSVVNRFCPLCCQSCSSNTSSNMTGISNASSSSSSSSSSVSSSAIGCATTTATTSNTTSNSNVSSSAASATRFVQRLCFPFGVAAVCPADYVVDAVCAAPYAPLPQRVWNASSACGGVCQMTEGIFASWNNVTNSTTISASGSFGGVLQCQRLLFSHTTVPRIQLLPTQTCRWRFTFSNSSGPSPSCANATATPLLLSRSMVSCDAATEVMRGVCVTDPRDQNGSTISTTNNACRDVAGIAANDSTTPSPLYGVYCCNASVDVITAATQTIPHSVSRSHSQATITNSFTDVVRDVTPSVSREPVGAPSAMLLYPPSGVTSSEELVAGLTILINTTNVQWRPELVPFIDQSMKGSQSHSPFSFDQQKEVLFGGASVVPASHAHVLSIQLRPDRCYDNLNDETLTIDLNTFPYVTGFGYHGSFVNPTTYAALQLPTNFSQSILIQQDRQHAARRKAGLAVGIVVTVLLLFSAVVLQNPGISVLVLCDFQLTTVLGRQSCSRAGISAYFDNIFWVVFPTRYNPTFGDAYFGVIVVHFVVGVMFFVLFVALARLRKRLRMMFPLLPLSVTYILFIGATYSAWRCMIYSDVGPAVGAGILWVLFFAAVAFTVRRIRSPRGLMFLRYHGGMFAEVLRGTHSPLHLRSKYAILIDFWHEEHLQYASAVQLAHLSVSSILCAFSWTSTLGCFPVLGIQLAWQSLVLILGLLTQPGRSPFHNGILLMHMATPVLIVAAELISLDCLAQRQTNVSEILTILTLVIYGVSAVVITISSFLERRYRAVAEVELQEIQQKHRSVELLVLQTNGQLNNNAPEELSKVAPHPPYDDSEAPHAVLGPLMRDVGKLPPIAFRHVTPRVNDPVSRLHHDRQQEVYFSGSNRRLSTSRRLDGDVWTVPTAAQLQRKLEKRRSARAKDSTQHGDSSMWNLQDLPMDDTEMDQLSTADKQNGVQPVQDFAKRNGWKMTSVNVQAEQHAPMGEVLQNELESLLYLAVPASAPHRASIIAADGESSVHPEASSSIDVARAQAALAGVGVDWIAATSKHHDATWSSTIKPLSSQLSATYQPHAATGSIPPLAQQRVVIALPHQQPGHVTTPPPPLPLRSNDAWEDVGDKPGVEREDFGEYGVPVSAVAPSSHQHVIGSDGSERVLFRSLYRPDSPTGANMPNRQPAKAAGRGDATVRRCPTCRRWIIVEEGCVACHAGDRSHKPAPPQPSQFGPATNVAAFDDPRRSLMQTQQQSLQQSQEAPRRLFPAPKPLYLSSNLDVVLEAVSPTTKPAVSLQPKSRSMANLVDEFGNELI